MTGGTTRSLCGPCKSRRKNGDGSLEKRVESVDPGVFGGRVKGSMFG